MLANEEIDAIYLPLPTGLRAEWAIKAAQAGKHLLCEKPCGIDLAELDEILAACKEAGVQFMDGVMFMHSARLKDLRQTLDDGKSVGKLRRIATQFSFCALEEFLTGNIRMHSDLEPSGLHGRLGLVQPALHSLDDELPGSAGGNRSPPQCIRSVGQPQACPDRVFGRSPFRRGRLRILLLFLPDRTPAIRSPERDEGKRPDRRLRFAFLRKPDRAHRVQCKLRLRRLRLPHGAPGRSSLDRGIFEQSSDRPGVQAFPNLFRSCSRRATGFPLAGRHPSHPADSHGLPGVCPKGRERSFPGLKRSLGRSPTSVHREHRSGDVTGGIGGEKDGRSLNFPQFSPSLEGGCAHDELHAVFGVGD